MVVVDEWCPALQGRFAHYNTEDEDQDQDENEDERMRRVLWLR